MQDGYEKKNHKIARQIPDDGCLLRGSLFMENDMVWGMTSSKTTGSVPWSN